MRNIKYIILVLLGVFLVGCGPIYDTSYVYVPPKTQVGMMCLTNCESSKVNCRMMQDMQRQNCEYRAEQDYEHCLHRHHDDENKCYRQTCNADYTICDEQYRSCYQTCGGTVTTQQVCVAFCGK